MDLKHFAQLHSQPTWGTIKKYSFLFTDGDMKYKIGWSYSKFDDMPVDIIWGTTVDHVQIFRIQKISKQSTQNHN